MIWSQVASAALPAFLASLVEFVEALTIVLAVGVTRGLALGVARRRRRRRVPRGADRDLRAGPRARADRHPASRGRRVAAVLRAALAAQSGAAFGRRDRAPRRVACVREVARVARGRGGERRVVRLAGRHHVVQGGGARGARSRLHRDRRRSCGRRARARGRRRVAGRRHRYRRGGRGARAARARARERAQVRGRAAAVGVRDVLDGRGARRGVAG